MSLIIIAIICLGIYYLYAFITDQETKRQRKDDPQRKESLEFYTTQANLFLQYKNYLYDNIDNFKKIPSRESIRKKIENDFPYYGNGISEWGITSDFFKFKLLHIYDKSEDDSSLLSETKLGKTFQIISIAYKNYYNFLKDIYKAGYKIRYCEGGYYSDFGDNITSKIFKIELNTKVILFFGLSDGGYSLEEYIKHHNIKTEDDEMYLFSEIRVMDGSKYTYPHFEIIKLRKDLSKDEYYDYFKKCLEIGNSIDF